MELHKVGLNDLVIIKELAQDIWPNTYKSILGENQLNYMLELIYSEDSLQKQLQAGHQFYLLKKEEGVVGFLDVQINCCSTNFLKVHKLYLLPICQGKGYGVEVLNEVFDIAKDNQQSGVFLNVNKYNKALYFYKKIGFEILKEEVIDIGNGYVMDDYVMQYLF